MNRRAFTLIELLVVIAIIAILAAILFPVFAQAKLAAKKSADLSNTKQIGTSTLLYLNDYDDAFYPHRFNCPGGALGASATCSEYIDTTRASGLKAEAEKFAGNGDGALKRYYWIFMLQPYSKNKQIFKNPGGADKFTPDDGGTYNCTAAGCSGNNYGGQNSYGHNDAWLSPAGSFSGADGQPKTIVATSVPQPAGMIMTTDASYYGAVPDLANESGRLDLSKFGDDANRQAMLVDLNAQGAQYKFYWKNIGGSKWSFSGGESGAYALGAGTTKAYNDGKGLFGGSLNTQFVDGHAKAISYDKLIGDICLWTTDTRAVNCGN